MTAGRWLASGVLAIFTLLPALQLQCEIACASDDAASTSTVADGRDRSVPMASSLAAPDECVGHATPSPMLPGATSVQRPTFIALIVNPPPDLLQSGFHAMAPPPLDEARRRGSAGIGIPLRI